VEVKVGDIYIRHSDGKICRVKWIGHTTVVLESEDGTRVRLTDIFDLEKGYSKRESKPTQ
jgi:L-ascorbate metabolism protein UlaG (beta-lactamase superfamily)